MAVTTSAPAFWWIMLVVTLGVMVWAGGRFYQRAWLAISDNCGPSGWRRPDLRTARGEIPTGLADFRTRICSAVCQAAIRHQTAANEA